MRFKSQMVKLRTYKGNYAAQLLEMIYNL